jgi:SAM-dependent methyltransferase
MLYAGAAVTGVDISPDLIDQARANHAGKARHQV